MKHRFIAALGACLLLAAPVAAQVISHTTVRKDGTLTTGGEAQTAIAANTYRLSWCIQNDAEEEEVLMVAQGATASATVGTELQPGQQACNEAGKIDRSAVSVWAATTGHRWFGHEGQ